jgi:hypothetical protein
MVTLMDTPMLSRPPCVHAPGDYLLRTRHEEAVSKIADMMLANPSRRSEISLLMIKPGQLNKQGKLIETLADITDEADLQTLQ